MNLAANLLQAAIVNAGFAAYRVGAGPLADRQAVAVVLEGGRAKLRTDGRAFFSPEAEPSEAILRAGWGTDGAYSPETHDEIRKQARALYNAPWGHLSSDRPGNRRTRSVYRALILDEGTHDRELINLTASVAAVLGAARWDQLESVLMYLDAFGVSGRLDGRRTARVVLDGLFDFWRRPGPLGAVGPARVVFSAVSRENFDAFASAIAP
ncbi:MAG TPA: hypothetical protein VLJ37_04430 [bacterium]|nr:hypothetical protein [bacterium]